MTWHRLSDSLSWSQGHRGKGYLLHDGTIKTWNVDQANPLDQWSVWQRNGEVSPSALNFEIDPDGGVITDQPTTKVESILLADPRLYDAGQKPTWEDTWDLADLDTKPKEENSPDYNFIMSKVAAREILQTRTERLGLHHHPFTGLPCDCQWGKPKRAPRYRIGSSQYIRQIRNQNQKIFRDENGQQFLYALDKLINRFPDAEAMAPWIASRYKHGDITVMPGQRSDNPSVGWFQEPEIYHHPGQYGTPFSTHIEDLHRPRTRRDPYSREQIPMEPVGHELALQLARDKWDQLPWHKRYDELGRMNMDRSGQLLATPKELAQLSMINYHPSLRDIRGGFKRTESVLNDWQNWFNARQHPTRRGVNIMEHNPQEVEEMVKAHKEALEEARKKERWLDDYVRRFEGQPTQYTRYEAPDVKHIFGPEAGKYQGWQVIKLNPTQAEGDSKALGHCIGSDDQPYKHNIDIGNIDAYSLRDPEGYPHVSWHINPSGDDIGHMQGQNYDAVEKYRPLITQFNEAHNLPDEEGNEEELENPYDEYVDIPAPTDIDEYVGQYENEYDWYPDDANIGEDTEIRFETPDWTSIAYDYLNRGGRYDLSNFFKILGYKGEKEDFAQAIEEEMDPEDNDHRQMVSYWNSEGAGTNSYVDMPPKEVNGIDEYNEVVDEGEEPEIGDPNRMANDYLDNPDYYGGHHYDQFHDQLRYNPNHADSMQGALHRNINWEDPSHLQAIDNWNQYWSSIGSSYAEPIEHPTRPLYNDYGELQSYSQEPEEEEPQGQTVESSWEICPRPDDPLGDWETDGGRFSAYNWEGLSPMEPFVTKPQGPRQEPRNNEEMIYSLIGEAVEKGDYEYARWLYQFLPEGMQPANAEHIASDWGRWKSFPPYYRNLSMEDLTDTLLPEIRANPPYIPEGQSILSPAIELQEWLGDLGGAEPEAPSIHHDSLEDTVLSPSVSPSPALPYFPPANIPKEYKQAALDEWDTAINRIKDNGIPHPELWCPHCGHHGILHYTGPTRQPDTKSFWFCPQCETRTARDVHVTGHPDIDNLIYQGIQNHHWRPRHEVQRGHQQVDELLNMLEPEQEGDMYGDFLHHTLGLDVPANMNMEQIQELLREDPDLVRVLREEARNGNLAPRDRGTLVDILDEHQGFDPERLPQLPLDDPELDAEDFEDEPEDRQMLELQQEEPDWNAVPEQHREQAQQQWEGLTPEQQQQMREIPPELMQRLQAGLGCAGCGQPIQGAFAQDAANPENFYHMQCLPEQDPHLASVRYAWDAPINQADATNDPLGKNPALIPSRMEDPDYLEASLCPACHQVHRQDEPCPETAVTQYKQQERQWYNRDNNALHSQPNGLTDHVKIAMPYNPLFIEQLTPEWREGAGGRTMLTAQHPDHGMVGYINHWPGQNGDIQIGKMQVMPQFQRQGVNTWMVNNLQQQYPGANIDYGMFTPDGQAWAESQGIQANPPYEMPHAAGWREDLEEEAEPDPTELRLAAMQEAITKLTAALEPQEKRPRKLVIKRDENGKMASIEEV